MQQRKLGQRGPEISEIGFGAWAIGGGWGPQQDEDSKAALHAALDAGVTFIDTAQGYGNGRSERLIGEVFRARQTQGKPGAFVATKTPPTAGPWPPSPYCRAEDRFAGKYLQDNIEQRLKALGTDCLDLLQLHTWTRAWNDEPTPLLALQKLRDQGKLRLIGLSTPEIDQNCVIQLMRDGLLDTVQVIYNIFEQEPAAQLLPVAQQTGTGVIVRVALDEGSLTGKFTKDHTFAPGDFRARFFAGDRLARTVDRVEKVREELDGSGYDLPQAALRFALAHPAVSCVIPGMRSVAQAQANTAVGDLPEMPAELVQRLRGHAWRRGLWYAGK